MRQTAQNFYLLFSNHKFRKVTDVLSDGVSGMCVVLKILSDAQKELSAGDISDIFGVSTARTAVILNTLEKKGLISKSKSEEDARKTIVSITDEGRKTLEERKKILFFEIDKFLGKLDERETQELYNILQKLLKE